ncbi:P-loop ATPase, Sll1717 family [Archangium lansingense]|uniref:ATP-binding protein n=1 Tax=Archangium lansingense TaxID=2995310 RepID=A0ABT4APY3_9BACT|nr:hypothetical protein [Archangium lansinium]MCY1083761.1 hypothetical protein [Archangium lansinium]
MTTAPAGNILGETTAEADRRMLDVAFYESRNYLELIHGSDFRFVVGRRGAGKSALFRKVTQALEAEGGAILITEKPDEVKTAALQEELKQLTERYDDARSITRLTWKVQILTSALEHILKHYKAEKLGETRVFLIEFKTKHQSLFEHAGLARSLEALRLVRRANPGVGARALLEKISDYFRLRRLQDAIIDGVQNAIGKRLVFLYDGLDEGWLPSPLATGVLGGLARAAADFREESHGLHCLLFIRDNMLRALVQLDPDYSRNIEGSTLRLQWDERSLLSFVSLRLRAAFRWSQENDTRIWTQFAKGELEGIDGFRRCLKLTLYRPRDLISLLNTAYKAAAAANRDRIIDADLQGAATAISEQRLQDLYKEYQEVLPGMSLFAERFRGGTAKRKSADVKQLLQDVVDAGGTGMVARDFALISTGADAFNALYSVGFLGIQDDVGDAVTFCHDGSNTDVQELPDSRVIVVHPCFWRALSLTGDVPQEEVLIRVDDEDDVAKGVPAKTEMKADRLRKLGQIADDLEKIPLGNEGAHAFEKWVHKTAQYLFAKDLGNIELHPNKSGLQQRDVVGSINADRGFWGRVARVYGVSQIVFECKNFEEMAAPEFRQAWGYLSGPYGRLLIMVTRSSQDKQITNRERALVKEGWDLHEKLIVLIPAILLQRAIRKMRTSKEQREDAIQTILNERLDKYERGYISQKAPRDE